MNTFGGELDMIWHYSRGKQQIRLEDTYDKEAGEFVLHIDHPSGYRETKRFGDARAFRSWLSGFEDQLVARHWMPRQVLPADTDRVAPAPNPRRPTNAPEVPTTVARTYTSDMRTFEVLLSRRTVKGVTFWMIERVFERGEKTRQVSIPGVQAIASASPDEAFARLSDCIDKWVWTDRSSR